MILQVSSVANKFDLLLRAFEKRYAPKIANALRNQLRRVAATLPLGVEYTRRRVQSTGIGQQMTDAIKGMHKDVGKFMAGYTLRGLQKHPVKKKGRVFRFSETWTRQIQEYFNLHLLESVDSINETTKNHILVVLNQGTKEGWSTERMVREINSKVYIGNRTERIVRTESVRAANFGVTLGADSYDYETVKEWNSVNDNRTRHSHRNVDGQTREHGETFSNGLQFPGDPEGPASEVVNCRCAMAIVPKRDANGRLIPKKRRLPPVGARQIVEAA